MTPNEAAQLLSLMRGTWPKLAGDEVANRLWLEDLCHLDAKPATEAFRSLRDSEPRTPSWALFREAYTAQARRFVPAIEAATEDDYRPTDEDKRRVRELVNELSSKLTGRRPRPFESEVF